MSQVLEYIIQHYTLFLGGAVLILLAIIGYYADKTNFGQGNNIKNNKNRESKNIPTMELTDVAESNEDKKSEQLIEEELKNISEVNNETELNQRNVEQIQNLELPNNLNSEIGLSSNSNSQEKELNLDANTTSTENNSTQTTFGMEYSTLPIVEETKSSLLNEDEFNKFDEEFNSILPKKEIINTDLLSDIEDLELGKTQKLDLNNVPDLDDIELPKIKSLVSEEQDIWKF